MVDAVSPLPGVLFPAITWTLGLARRDTLLTREEYQAMAAGLAHSDAPATGTILLTDWITQHKDTLGRTSAHELRRHFLPTATRGAPMSSPCPVQFRHLAAPTS